MGKKKIKKRLTIERQLEKYYEKEKHAERNAVLWHAWCQNKRCSGVVSADGVVSRPLDWRTIIPGSS